MVSLSLFLTLPLDGLVVDDLEQDPETSEPEADIMPNRGITAENRPETWRHQFLDVFDGF